MNREGPLKAWTRFSRFPALALLLLVSLAFYLPGFTTLPPVDRDEAHFAQASKQMLESGNFIDIRMQEATRYNKPIGIYWLQSAAVALVGRPLNDIWPYRLPSLAGALLALVFLARLGGRLFDRRVGLIAALLLGASLLLGVEARLAKTDAALLATSLAAFDGLAAVYLGRAKRVNALQFWIALSLGILIKGPVLLFFLLTTAGTVSLVQRRWRWLAASSLVSACRCSSSSWRPGWWPSASPATAPFSASPSAMTSGPSSWAARRAMAFRRASTWSRWR